MRSSGIRTLVDATPDTRDRTVDLVRAGAIVLVVTGHWLAVTVSVDDGRLTGGNVLALIPAVQPLTWVAQVMPLFFLVGGWATAASWRSSVARGTATLVWLRARLDRLLRPTAGFVLVGAAAAAAARLAGLDPALVDDAAWLVAIALWFLAVYVLVVAAVPLLVAGHDRCGLGLPIALVAATAAADLLRLGPAVPVPVAGRPCWRPAAWPPALPWSPSGRTRSPWSTCRAHPCTTRRRRRWPCWRSGRRSAGSSCSPRRGWVGWPRAGPCGRRWWP